jgi:hypothetical protein
MHVGADTALPQHSHQRSKSRFQGRELPVIPHFGQHDVSPLEPTQVQPVPMHPFRAHLEDSGTERNRSIFPSETGQQVRALDANIVIANLLSRLRPDGTTIIYGVMQMSPGFRRQNPRRQRICVMPLQATNHPSHILLRGRE